jgi:hypothetical protein
LSEYAASLHGWRDLFQVLGELYLHSFPELRRVRGNDLLRIEVVAEKPGSYETVLTFVFGAIAGGILGNRADAGVVWSFKKLVEWYQRAIREYVRRKSQTTDVTAVSAALEQVAAEAGIPLDGGETTADTRAHGSRPRVLARGPRAERSDHGRDELRQIVACRPAL